LLDRGLRVVSGVGPAAVGGEREGAVAVAAGGAGLRGEIGLALIGVGDGQRAAVGQVAGGDGHIFGDGAGGDAADHGGVVGAVDGNGDELACGAVGGDGGEAVGDRLAGAELLDRGLRVVSGVGPAAVGGEREGAVAVAAGGAGLRGEIGLALIGVGDGQRAAGGQVAGGDGHIFGDGAGGDAADHGGVVGAVDGDGDELACGAVGGDGGEAVGYRLAGAELLDRGLRVVSGVGP